MVVGGYSCASSYASCAAVTPAIMRSIACASGHAHVLHYRAPGWFVVSDVSAVLLSFTVTCYSAVGDCSHRKGA